MDMDLESARALIVAAEAAAGRLAIRVATSVVDAGGNPVAFTRMDGTQLASITIAHGKAFTGSDRPRRSR